MAFVAFDRNVSYRPGTAARDRQLPGRKNRRVVPSGHFGVAVRVLFLCSQNRLRSPTAETVFADWPGIECTSAGTNRGADTPLSQELVEWAEIIFCMEKQHQRKLLSSFRTQLKTARVICLGIPDDFRFMQPELVTLLQKKVGPYLR